MEFSNQFICASEVKNEYDNHIPAPIFKRVFTLEIIGQACLQVCGLGFYRAFLNGVELTKGKLAPYISNTDDTVYYDEYEVEKYLRVGKNELSVLLGNGWQNAIGGEIWWLDKAPWRSQPKLAVKFAINNQTLFEGDEQFLVADSPITFDDLWAGEHYDARKEDLPKTWRNAIKTVAPKGEKRLCTVNPVQIKAERKPIAIFDYKSGYIYDFGLNTAGVCRLQVQASAGQKISLYHFEIFENGEIFKDNISFGKRTRENYWQQNEYVCKDGLNIYEPSFTYHGFRYVYVEGLTSAQATKDALTMCVIGTGARQKLAFSCSDARVERLVENVLNSNYSNFMYYPTDCPQREKNGWTGDAMLSAEQMLLSMDVCALLKEWLFNIRKAQRENGQLPRIVPIGEWGFESGESGPNWDGVLIELPYQIYQIEKDCNVIAENLPAIDKYLRYLGQKREENGLLRCGLGDREETFSHESSAHATPNYITDTLTAISLCEKTAKMAKIVGQTQVEAYAKQLKKELISAFRKNCVGENCCVQPYTQTGQLLAVYAGIFTQTEKKTAFARLLDVLHSNGDKPRMGMIGYRYLFDFLAENGEADFVYKMLLSEEYTGYLYYVKAGMSSMMESFVELKEQGSYMRLDGGKVPSLNHHWYGHILGSIVKYVAGVRVDTYNTDKITISPTFVQGLENISIKTELFGKEISVSWVKHGQEIELLVETDLAYQIKVENALISEEKMDEKKVRYLLKNS